MMILKSAIIWLFVFVTSVSLSFAQPAHKGGVPMKKLKIGCGKPTGARVGGQKKEAFSTQGSGKGEEVAMTGVRVGQKAPDFEAPAYQGGKFGQVKLSDYLGNWVVLCFYPGDFPFV